LAFIVRTYSYTVALKDWLIIDLKPKGKCLIFVAPTFRISSKTTPHDKEYLIFSPIYYDTLH